MAIGVAMANAILLVTFAEQRRRKDCRPHDAAIEGRDEPPAGNPDDELRDDRRHVADGAGPGRGGQQNAPLGRAVIGGLLAATLATLFVLPSLFSIVPEPSEHRVAFARSDRSAQLALSHHAQIRSTAAD